MVHDVEAAEAWTGLCGVIFWVIPAIVFGWWGWRRSAMACVLGGSLFLVASAGTLQVYLSDTTLTTTFYFLPLYLTLAVMAMIAYYSVGQGLDVDSKALPIVSVGIGLAFVGLFLAELAVDWSQWGVAHAPVWILGAGMFAYLIYEAANARNFVYTLDAGIVVEQVLTMKDLWVQLVGFAAMTIMMMIFAIFQLASPTRTDVMGADTTRAANGYLNFACMIIWPIIGLGVSLMKEALDPAKQIQARSKLNEAQAVASGGMRSFRRGGNISSESDLPTAGAFHRTNRASRV